MGRQLSSVDHLILQAAAGTRSLAEEELRHVVELVARVGFDPLAHEQARGRIAGLRWRGRILAAKDPLPPADKHYLWHVLANGEWPDGTSLDDYLDSIRRVILDPTTGIFTNRYQGEWSLGFLRESRDLEGPGSRGWLLVQYRVSRGHWTTAFQPFQGLSEISQPGWSDIRWLRRPTHSERP